MAGVHDGEAASDLGAVTRGKLEQKERDMPFSENQLTASRISASAEACQRLRFTA